jgi:hypothetical protein
MAPNPPRAHSSEAVEYLRRFKAGPDQFPDHVVRKPLLPITPAALVNAKLTKFRTIIAGGEGPSRGITGRQTPS